MSDMDAPSTIQAFTKEQVQEHLSTLQQVAQMLDATLAVSDRSASAVEDVTRMATHIGEMCHMDHIAGSGVDLSPFRQTQRRALAWLAQD